MSTRSYCRKYNQEANKLGTGGQIAICLPLLSLCSFSYAHSDFWHGSTATKAMKVLLLTLETNPNKNNWYSRTTFSVHQSIESRTVKTCFLTILDDAIPISSSIFLNTHIF